jgi:hypothetical protein
MLLISGTASADGDMESFNDIAVDQVCRSIWAYGDLVEHVTVNAGGATSEG